MHNTILHDDNYLGHTLCYLDHDSSLTLPGLLQVVVCIGNWRISLHVIGWPSRSSLLYLDLASFRVASGGPTRGTSASESSACNMAFSRYPVSFRFVFHVWFPQHCSHVCLCLQNLCTFAFAFIVAVVLVLIYNPSGNDLSYYS